MQSFKVWNADRNDRRCVSACSLVELKCKSAEKLGYSCSIQDLRLVCELDGQPIEDQGQLDRVYQTRQVLLLLRPNEKWTPSVESTPTAIIGSIPQVVVDALRKMQLMDKPPPSWKLIDNRGSVTVLLHWDQRDRLTNETSRVLPNGCTCTPLPALVTSGSQASADATAYLELLQVGKRPCHAHNYGKQLQVVASRGRLSPRPPSFNEDEPRTNGRIGGDQDEEEDLCEQLINGTPILQLMSPSAELAKCDFHCASLHSGSSSGGQRTPTPQRDQRNVLRSTGTSPMPPSNDVDTQSRPISPGSSLLKKPRETQKGHVRFLDDPNAQQQLHQQHLLQIQRQQQLSQPLVQISLAPNVELTNGVSAIVGDQPVRKCPAARLFPVGESSALDRVEEESRDEYDSSTSDMLPNGQQPKISTTAASSETDLNEEDPTEQPNERHLLLIDQLDADQMMTSATHLSVKEIGQILEKLSSKIIDVEKLEREKDGNTHSWLIKATVKGDLVSEIGVVHNGRYYGIVQHPAYP